MATAHLFYDQLTQFHEKELYGKYYLLRRDIINSLQDESCEDVSWGPSIVRLAWQSSATFDKFHQSGGCNGAKMRFYPENIDPKNKGLDLVRNKLANIKQKHNENYDTEISIADLWIFASYVSIEAMGGPYIRFSSGRIDEDEQQDLKHDDYNDEEEKKMCPINHDKLPSANGDAQHIRKIFNRMGFDDQEIVVLIGGGHVLGKCHIENSGYDGQWVDNPLKFDNEYFQELFENQWKQKEVKQTGKIQYVNDDEDLIMLPTDILMIKDEEFKKWSEIYYKDNDRFMIDFAVAWKKLTELGCDNLKEVGLADIVNEFEQEVFDNLTFGDGVEEQYID